MLYNNLRSFSIAYVNESEKKLEKQKCMDRVQFERLLLKPSYSDRS